MRRDERIRATKLDSFGALNEIDGVTAERNSDITIQLTKEHRAIIRNLRRLIESRTKLKTVSRFNQTMFFSSFADSLNAHFKREEQLLFPRLSLVLGHDVCEKLTREHAEIMDATDRLDEQTQNVEDPLGRLEQLFRTHAYTEENVLFWYLEVDQQSNKAISYSPL